MSTAQLASFPRLCGDHFPYQPIASQSLELLFDCRRHTHSEVHQSIGLMECSPAPRPVLRGRAPGGRSFIYAGTREGVMLSVTRLGTGRPGATRQCASSRRISGQPGARRHCPDWPRLKGLQALCTLDANGALLIPIQAERARALITVRILLHGVSSPLTAIPQAIDHCFGACKRACGVSGAGSLTAS